MVRLRAHDLGVTMGDRVLLERFSHQFSAGSIVALVGDNGSGKTTLLKTLAGLALDGEGLVFVNGHDVFSLQPLRRAQLISMLLQHSPEQPYCTARSRIAHGFVPTLGYQHFLDDTVNELIEQTAAELTITHLLDRTLSRMSGGEQRLVHIAKCLINPAAEVLLMDEPSVFLDFTQQTNLIANLKAQQKKGRLIIFSSHDAAFIKRTADSVVMIKDARLHALTVLP
jgi:iron complex transport system ATP-binding protein